MSTIMITGSCSGLGGALCESLRPAHTLIGVDHFFGDDVRTPDVGYLVGGIRSATGDWDTEVPPLDVLINCAGVNGIDMLEDVTDDLWDRVMDTNAKGIMKMSQAMLPNLIAAKGTIINVVSNAATMPMTSSIAYNASKGAAKIMTAQMARELTRRHGITVFSISPNKLRGTGMSKQIDAEVVRTRGWTMEEAQKYQLAGLLAGEETDPQQIADLVAFLLEKKERHAYLTGCDLQLGL